MTPIGTPRMASTEPAEQVKEIAGLNLETPKVERRPPMCDLPHRADYLATALAISSYLCRSGTTVPAPLDVSQNAVQASISFRRLSNKSLRR
jgi:hypothetical protein